MNGWLGILVAAGAMAGSLLLFAFFFGSTLMKLAERKVKKMAGKYGEELEALLPCTNCGECGYADCHAYAQAMIWESVSPALCTRGGEEMRPALEKCLREYERSVSKLGNQ